MLHKGWPEQDLNALSSTEAPPQGGRNPGKEKQQFFPKFLKETGGEKPHDHKTRILDLSQEGVLREDQEVVQINSENLDRGSWYNQTADLFPKRGQWLLHGPSAERGYKSSRVVFLQE